MESAESQRMKFLIGRYPIVDFKIGGITVDLGKGVYIHFYIGDFPHSLKVGDKLPLYTEVPYAKSRSTSEQ